MDALMDKQLSCFVYGPVKIVSDDFSNAIADKDYSGIFSIYKETSVAAFLCRLLGA